MSPLAVLPAARSADRRRTQGGYVLIVTLVAVGVFSLVVVALLDLVAGDSTANVAYASAASTTRATNGALEVAVDRLKVTPASQLSATDPCAGWASNPLSIEGTQVAVDCTPAGGPVPMLPAAPPNSTVLTLLGNYNGTLPQGVYNTMSGAVSPLISDVAAAIDQMILNGPGLIHGASEPLKIVGDVKVRQSTLTAVQPASYPAIDVTGTFRQGDVGPLGDINLGPFGSSPPCGLLADNLGNPETGLRVRAKNGPQCLLGREAVSPIAGPTVAAPASWTPAEVVSRAQAAPTCPAGSKLVTFTPGSYNAVQVAALNLRFHQGTCDDVTFWFPPGNYYFDAGGNFGDDANSLIIDNTTSRWVFGAANGWSSPAGASASNFPEACDRSQEGVSITLSSRTAIKHKAGRVAICGRHQGSTDLPAIYQQAGGDNLRWAGEPSAAVAPPPNPLKYVALNTPGAVAATSANPTLKAGFPAWGNAFDDSEPTQTTASATCTAWCAAAVTMTGFSEPGEPAPPGNLDTRPGLNKFRILGSTVNADTDPSGNGSSTKVEITFNDGSNRGCVIIVPDVPRNHLTTPFDIDLFANGVGITNSCRDNANLHSASQLENATVTVYLVPKPMCDWVFIFCIPRPSVTATIDYAWLETTTTTVLPASPISTAVAPAAGKSLNIFGPVYAPRSQIEVSWQGGANTLPIFVGGVVARGLSSIGLPGAHVGVLASKSLSPGARHVILRAVAGGRLIGTAEVLVNDSDLAGMAQDAGRELAVLDWRYCNLPSSATSC